MYTVSIIWHAKCYPGTLEGIMKYLRGVVVPFFAVVFLLVLSSTAHPQNEKQPKDGPKATASLTGCIDEDNGHYLLVDDREMKPIADLEAEGFPTESFAKHLGHKVTVRGTSTAGAGRPLFRVRAIEPVSDTCAPQVHNQR